MILSLLLLMHYTSAADLRITTHWLLHRCDNVNLLCWNSHHVDRFTVVTSLIYFRELLTFALLPPATKSGQCNIFRSVCQEFCPHGGSPGPHPGERLRGVAGGNLQAHTQWEVEGSGLGGGLQAHTWGG